MSYLEIVILYALSEQPGHGYEIRRRLEPVLGRTASLNPNVLYPALRRFEEMGAVVKTVEPQSGRPARHIYRLTDQGQEILHSLLTEFPPELARRDNEFETRVAFFELLDRDERLAILQARERELADRLEYANQIRKLAAAPSPGPWAVEVAEESIRRVRAGQRWVKRLRERVEHPARAPMLNDR